MSQLITQKGAALLKAKIAIHEQKVRDIGKEVGQEAGINCDWHDNFGYEDARRRLEMASGTLAVLVQQLRTAKLIQVAEQSDVVAVGVTVRFLLGSEEKWATIGALGESDPKLGLLSYDSPLGHALMGMCIGEEKDIKLGGKELTVEIVSLFPPSYKYHQLIEGLISTTNNN